ncbi:MAG: BatD family protein [Bacteroidetes bacterium]|nr:BatD family protein [Bacteroidota bacterium]
MRRKVKYIISFITLYLSISPLPTFAQNVTFTASTSETTIGIGEQFEVTFTLNCDDPNASKKFTPPKFDPFVVLSGPNQSTSMQWINGQVTASISYSYRLYARNSGKFTIPPATIEYKGKTLSSQPLTITVTQSQSKKQSDKTTDGVDVGDNLFLRAYVNKSHARVGEQITLTYKLYFRVSISGYDLIKAPTYEGFWSEDFDLPKQPPITTEVVDGKQYRVATIKKTALFATQPGKLTIAPLEVRCAVQVQVKRRTNDPFDIFFNDPFFQHIETRQVDIQSNVLSVTIAPLPANTPSEFSGGIGKYSFSASIDKNSVAAGDAITLRVNVSGTGNIKLVTLPKPQFPADFEVYEPKLSETISRDGDIIRGKKSAEYLLIPRNAGQRTIDPIKFTYFDLENATFVTHSSPRFEITVKPGKTFAGSTPLSTDKEAIRILGEDIRYIKLSTSSLKRKDEPSSPLVTILLLVVPPLVFLGTWSYQKRREKLYGDIHRLLFETAGREAQRRLKRARDLFEKGDAESYNAEVLNALTEYLLHKLQLKKAEFSLERALEDLRNHNVPEQTLQNLKHCIERAQFARYAPQTDTKTTRRELLDLATHVIQTIESTFRKQTQRLRRT